MRAITILLFTMLLAGSLKAAQAPMVVLGDSTNFHFISLGEHAVYFEDPTGLITVNDITANLPEIENRFAPLPNPVSNLGFTTSDFWVKFEIQNNAHLPTEFLLEVARPLTNEANLYVKNENQFTILKRNGDALPFDARTVRNRKLLFHLNLETGNRYEFILHLKSDGEVITLPIKLWNKEAFRTQNNLESYFFGIYFGFLLFVTILYLFFFFVLRERSFLYYTFYVASLFFLQLSLDGFSYELLWSNQVWWANHSILIFASISVFCLLLYAKEFLQLSTNLPLFARYFNIFMGLSLINLVLSLTGPPLYAFAFPAANAISLLGILFVFLTIVYAISRKIKVNMLFAIAFIVTILGAVLFILGNFNLVGHSLLIEHSIKFATSVEVVLLSLSLVIRYRDAQRAKELAQAESLKKLEEMNELKDQINEELEKQVAERTKEINEQNIELANINKDITDSIRYAKRIQEAILPSEYMIDNNLSNAFILYLPKDIVSGDFYWMQQSEDKVMFAAVDCTGHGVPGAFMSIVGQNALNQAVLEHSLDQPAAILDYLNKAVSDTLRQNQNGEVVRDGMDIALCSYCSSTKTLEYAGAYNPLYHLRNSEITETKADKVAIGAYVDDPDFRYTNHKVDIEPGDSIFVFSDGFADQFGGPKGKKYKYSTFRNFLISIQKQPIREQGKLLNEEFQAWKGNQEQIDDVCVIGAKWD